MKKRLLLFSCLLFLSFFKFLPVSAVPVTYERTASNLRVPEDILAKEYNAEEILKIPSVDEKAKIYDFADLLTEAEESKIYIQLNEYIKNTGLDAAIVTVNHLNGFVLSEYTYHFYDYNFFQDNGIAFVIYKDGDKSSIFMGNNGPRSSEVFVAYTDNRIEEILRYVYENHIKSGDYVGACEDYIKLVDGFYIKSFGDHRVGEEPSEEVVEKESFPIAGVFIISLALSFIVVALVATKYKRPVRRVDLTARKSINPTSMIVKCEYDRPVGSKETSKK